MAPRKVTIGPETTTHGNVSCATPNETTYKAMRISGSALGENAHQRPPVEGVNRRQTSRYGVVAKHLPQIVAEEVIPYGEDVVKDEKAVGLNDQLHV